MKFSGLLTFILLFSLSAAGCGRPVNEQDLSSPNPPQKTDLQNRVSEDDDQKQTSNAASEQDDSSVSNKLEKLAQNLKPPNQRLSQSLVQIYRAIK